MSVLVTRRPMNTYKPARRIHTLTRLGRHGHAALVLVALAGCATPAVDAPLTVR